MNNDNQSSIDAITNKAMTESPQGSELHGAFSGLMEKVKIHSDPEKRLVDGQWRYEANKLIQEAINFDKLIRDYRWKQIKSGIEPEMPKYIYLGRKEREAFELHIREMSHFTTVDAKGEGRYYMGVRVIYVHEPSFLEFGQ